MRIPSNRAGRGANFILRIGGNTVLIETADQHWQSKLVEHAGERQWTLLALCPNRFEPFLKFLEMRTGPVDLLAARTTAELVVIDFGKRLEFVDYVGLGCLFQRCVTS